MNMLLEYRRHLALLVAACCTLVAAPARADLVIDNFGSTTLAWPLSRNALGTTTVNEFVPLSTISGTRATSVIGQSFASPGLDRLDATIAPGPGLFDFRSTSGADGQGRLTYNSVAPMNLSNSAGIRIDFAQFDHGGGLDMPTTVTLGDGISVANLTLALTAPGAQSLFFDLNDFAGIGSLDLANLFSIDILFDPQLGQDFRVSGILAVAGQVIPEPTALAVWTMTFVVAAGLFWRRRRIALK